MDLFWILVGAALVIGLFYITRKPEKEEVQPPLVQPGPEPVVAEPEVAPAPAPKKRTRKPAAAKPEVKVAAKAPARMTTKKTK